LKDPANEAARLEVAVALAERQQAESALEERLIRAPGAGVVTDVRVVPGQYVNPGEPVLAFADAQTGNPLVVALLPGWSRPHLKPGQRLRFRLEGQPSFQDVVIEAVAQSLIGPAEARR